MTVIIFENKFKFFRVKVPFGNEQTTECGIKYALNTIIKIGSRSKELKGSKSSIISGKIVFTNTCAFDALASLIMIYNLTNLK